MSMQARRKKNSIKSLSLDPITNLWLFDGTDISVINFRGEIYLTMVTSTHLKKVAPQMAPQEG
jgi:hypothetical protein